MACQAMDCWTFTGLVGAFLDLAIAYFLLCASATAFFASKFLGIFGLSLPCPCNGLFGNINRNYCGQQTLLVDIPMEKVSSVQLSVRSKFPFDAILPKDDMNTRLIGEAENENVTGTVEMGGSSIPDVQKSQDMCGSELGFSGSEVKHGGFDLKGKGVLNQRPRSGGIRRHRRGNISDYSRKCSSCDCDQSVGDHPDPPSPSSVNKDMIAKGKLVSLDSGAEAIGSQWDEKAPVITGIEEIGSHGFDVGEFLDESKPSETDSSSVNKYRSNVQRKYEFDGNEKNAITVLEQALEEEHAAQAALYLELEKERSAAATAADEAMAMILRLQEEKASIEMEARQYQRILEEKSAYDAEEMDILKEILLRREREKHFLEKEVEAYRQMIYLENEQLQGGFQEIEDLQRLASSVDLIEDPVLMLHQLGRSINRKEMAKNGSGENEWDEGNKSPEKMDTEKKFSWWNDDENLGFQEKDIVCVDAYSGQRKGKKETRLPLHELNMPEQRNCLDNAILCHGMITKTIGGHYETEAPISLDAEISKEDGNFAVEGNKHSLSSGFETEPRIHDVHVIGDSPNLCNDVVGNNRELLSVFGTSSIYCKGDLQSESSEFGKNKTSCTKRTEDGKENDCSSGIIVGLLPTDITRRRTSLSDLRRSSSSAVDLERLKIDTEIWRLRERLRVVQEGREKLSFSIEHRERGNIQLQLLEDIARQLQEIRQLTEPRKAVRQASLPPPTLEVMSKKRRCRSVSLGLQKST